MENFEIIRILLTGSQNLDKMETRVRHAVGMLSGLAKQSTMFAQLKDRKFEGIDCTWEVYTWETSGGERNIRVRCRMPPDNWIAFTTEEHRFPRRAIQTVYENLPILIEGFLDALPDVQQGPWQHFLKASKVDMKL